MNSEYIILILFALVGILSAAKNPKALVNLSVYYESRDETSKKFILEELQSTMKIMHKNVNIKFVPFGLATIQPTDSFKIVCRNGHGECLSNMIQDCTLNLMQNRPNLDKLNYVACEMKNGSKADSKLSCVQTANVTITGVKECLTSPKGTHLQFKSEYLTKLAGVSVVPTVVINESYMQAVTSNSHLGLIDSICSIISEVRQCQRYYNSIALNHILNDKEHLYIY